MKFSHLAGLLLPFLLSVPAFAERVAGSKLPFPSAPPPTHGYRLIEAFPSLRFRFPVALVSPPGDTQRLFVVEREGRIQLIQDVNNPTKTLFLDISSEIYQGLEGGLLSVAFHPRFSENGYFFVYYTANTSPPGMPESFEDRLARFQVSALDPNVADAASEVLLIRQPDPTTFHNAGDLAFGADGYLYCSFGEGPDWEDHRSIDRSLFGSIIRIDVDERPDNLFPNTAPFPIKGYRIPADNPFVGAKTFWGRPMNASRVRSEIWAHGFRNPYRFSFDPVDHRLFVGDVGWMTREEVNLVEKGKHYGWKAYEGTLPINTWLLPPSAQVTPPLFEYAGDGMRGCIMGGVVYRGSKYPNLDGSFLFGDYNRGWIKALQLSADGHVEVQTLIEGAPHYTTAFGINPATGDILATEYGNSPIYRLDYSETVAGADDAPKLLSQVGAFSSLATLSPVKSLEPYEINLPFWSDGALKQRWVHLPGTAERFSLSTNAPWLYPVGAVWVKHFDMEMTPGDPGSRRRLETRFLVKGSNQFYGLTYRWRPDNSDADLVPPEGADEDLAIVENGVPRAQHWRYPSRTECMLCHYSSGPVLGFTTAQLNRDVVRANSSINQLHYLFLKNYLWRDIDDPGLLPRLFSADSIEISTEIRARSYLAANCSYCHQGNAGTTLGRGPFDARISVPLNGTGLLWNPPTDFIDDYANRLMAPGDLTHSILPRRLDEMGRYHMPPLGTFVRNDAALQLVQTWIKETAFVAGRYLLYNNTYFDNYDPRAGASDDNAIALDKQALMPGDTASFRNVSNYPRGISGFMVDIFNLAGNPDGRDFELSAGNTTDFSKWTRLPQPTVAVRRGAGLYGSDRVTVLPGSLAVNTWLRIRIRPSANTGLGATDEFYFGSAPGDIGNSGTEFRVDATDLAEIRRNSQTGKVPITSPYDINRDGNVNALDVILANGYTTSSASKPLIVLKPSYEGWMASHIAADSSH